MKKPKKNPLEWIVFAASTLLVLGLIGVLIHAALGRTSGPADLKIELGEPEARGGRYMVPVHVRNEGGLTAEDVRIEVVLRTGETDVETAEFVLGFVPAQSDREGWVSFERDPSCCELAARPVGFESP